MVPELRPFQVHRADIALIIDTLNHDGSLSELLNPVDRINKFLAKKGVVRATDAETRV